MIKWILYLFCISHVMAFEIAESDFRLPGEDEMSAKLFLKKNNTSFLLPVHLGYNKRVFSADQTVAAINFHGLSNYNGIDLVIDTGGKILVVPNVWELIKNQLFEKSIIPTLEFSHTYLEAIEFEQGMLLCELAATSDKVQSEVKAKFYVQPLISTSSVELEVKPLTAR